MRANVLYKSIGLIIPCFFATFSPSLSAEEGLDQKWSLGLEGAFGRYASVDGDIENFRAHHWMTDGWAWGIKDLTFERKSSNGAFMSFEGSAIPDQNDIVTKFSLNKENLGFLNVDYGAFRKYYDGTGGIYYKFTQPQANELNRDLRMDIGHLLVEMGTAPSDTSEIGLMYERHSKDGQKSRLSWGAVKENATTRNIAPSWQDIDEITDIVALKGKNEVAGFTVNGEQRFEFVQADLFREERNLSPTSKTAADKKIRQQTQEPKADVMTTTLRGERWFLNDKTFVSLGYRYSLINNDEFETLYEFDESGTPRSFPNPKNKPNARADNAYDAHAWLAHFVTNVTSSLSFITKLKAEVLDHRGNSTYPSETTDPPDSTVNTVEVSHIENNINHLGENFSLRYSGLPKTSFYTEWDLEQTRNWLTEERNSIAGQSSSDANEVFARETLTHIQKNSWTVGMRSVPFKIINVTNQFRHQLEDNDYDDIFETAPGSSTARSAFIDGLEMGSNEASSRWTLKPYRWLQASLRYQFLNRQYFSRAQAQTEVETQTLSNTFTYDVYLQPNDKVIFNASFTQENLKVSTPAALASSTQIPYFNAAVNSWLLSTSYFPRENLSYTGSLLYSTAGNYDDFSSIGLPLGVDNERLDATLGLRWTPKKDITIEPRYSYYRYDGNSQVDAGDYTAHVAWLDLNIRW